MNYILLCSIVAFLLFLELLFLVLKFRKARKLNDTAAEKETDKGSTCQEIEDCWCCEYNLSKEKKEQIMKEFDALQCGKSVESMLQNKG